MTADKDFGELIYRQGRVSSGVVLVRLAGLAPARKAGIVASAIRDHADSLLSAFAVITPGALRIRGKQKKPDVT